MTRAIDVDKAIEIIEKKQKELCPVGRYGRNYVYGSDREKWGNWDEIIDAIDDCPTIDPESLRPRWIPVMERLPDKSERYLVFNGRFEDIVGYVDGDWKIFDDGIGEFELYPYCVTHWMPLPEPPGVNE